MASYSIATTALALGVPRKRLENILLRCPLPGVPRGRQGRATRLGRPAVLALAVVIELQDRLGVPIPVAARLLPKLVAPGRSDSERGAAGLILGPLALTVDLAALERELATAIATAMEMAPRPRRGRPPGRRQAVGEAR